jgi:hypothetical protein
MAAGALLFRLQDACHECTFGTTFAATGTTLNGGYLARLGAYPSFAEAQRWSKDIVLVFIFNDLDQFSPTAFAQ